MKAVLLALFAAAMTCSCADPPPPDVRIAEPTEIRLWPEAHPIARPNVTGPERSYAVEPDEYVAGRAWTVLENVSDPTMTVYPAEGANTGVAVVVFPGGGYNILAIDLEGTEICAWLTSRGVTCAVLKYRVPGSGHSWNHACRCRYVPQEPMALQDAQRAMRLFRQSATEFGVDPNRIGVVGFSAGGHLVAAVSTISDSAYDRVDEADDRSSVPNFAIALYPGHLWSESRGDSLRLITDTGTPFTPTAETPPTLIVQAQDDPVDDVRHSLTYYLALRSAGVPTEMHLYANGGHGFGVRRTEVPITHWTDLAEEWLVTIGMLSEPLPQ
jgi:acetyl esterase/lipase